MHAAPTRALGEGPSLHRFDFCLAVNTAREQMQRIRTAARLADVSLSDRLLDAVWRILILHSGWRHESPALTSRRLLFSVLGLALLDIGPDDSLLVLGSPDGLPNHIAAQLQAPGDVNEGHLSRREQSDALGDLIGEVGTPDGRQFATPIAVDNVIRRLESWSYVAILVCRDFTEAGLRRLQDMAPQARIVRFRKEHTSESPIICHRGVDDTVSISFSLNVNAEESNPISCCPSSLASLSLRRLVTATTSLSPSQPSTDVHSTSMQRQFATTLLNAQVSPAIQISSLCNCAVISRSCDCVETDVAVFTARLECFKIAVIACSPPTITHTDLLACLDRPRERSSDQALAACTSRMVNDAEQLSSLLTSIGCPTDVEHTLRNFCARAERAQSPDECWLTPEEESVLLDKRLMASVAKHNHAGRLFSFLRSMHFSLSVKRYKIHATTFLTTFREELSRLRLLPSHEEDFVKFLTAKVTEDAMEMFSIAARVTTAKEEDLRTVRVACDRNELVRTVLRQLVGSEKTAEILTMRANLEDVLG